MFARVCAVGFNQFGSVVGMIDLDAIQGNLGAHFIEQIDIVVSKALFAATWMGDERDSAAAVRGLYRFGHIRVNRDKSGFADHAQTALPVVYIAMLAQQADVVTRQRHVSAAILQHLLLAWELVSLAAQLLVHGA